MLYLDSDPILVSFDSLEGTIIGFCVYELLKQQ